VEEKEQWVNGTIEQRKKKKELVASPRSFSHQHLATTSLTENCM
jgi:hypothetical protein